MKRFLILVFLLALTNTAEATSEPVPYRCFVSNNRYVNGQEFNRGYFISKCVVYDSGWYTVGVACSTPGKKRIEVGGTVHEEGFAYSCTKEEGILKRIWDVIPATDVQCLHKYNDGEEFDRGYFVNKCVVSVDGWYTVGVACYTPGKKRIEIGASINEDEFSFTCTKEEGILKRIWDLIDASNVQCLDKYNNGEEFDNGDFIAKCVVDDDGWHTVGVGCYTPNKKRIEVGRTVDEEGFAYSCRRDGEGLKRSWKWIPSQKCEFRHKGEHYSYDNNEEFLYGQKFYYKCIITNEKVSYRAMGCYTGKTKISIGQTTQEGGTSYKCIKTQTGGLRLRTTYDTRKKQCKVGTQQYDVDTEFDVGKYVHRCTMHAGHTESRRVACRSGQRRRIDIGRSVTEGQYTYKCVIDYGRVLLKISYPMKCNIANKTYEDGEEIETENRKYILRCVVGPKGWGTYPVACKTDDKRQRINLGQTIVEGKFTYTCEKALYTIMRTKTYKLSQKNYD